MVIIKIIFHIKAIIKKFFLKIIFGKKIKFGKKVTWRKNFMVAISNGKIEIGDGVFFNNNCSLSSDEMITIGKHCIFGENVKIYDNNHIFKKNELIKAQGLKSEPIIIGDNNWIANNVCILKGARIGDNCVIGAGCVIDKEIPSNSLVKNTQNIQIQEIRR